VTAGRASATAVLLAVLVCVVAAGPVAAQTVLAVEAGPTSVSAYGGVVAWSSFDETSRTYRLRMWSAGLASEVPTPARRVPFDVDVGPDARGRPTLVYSRCRRDPEPVSAFSGQPEWRWARGCDLYRHRPGAGGERRLRAVSSRRASESLPAVWGDAIAFSRVAEPRGRRRGEVPTLHLTSLRGKPLRRIRVGSTGRLERFDPGGPPIGGPTPTEMDLHRRTLVFAWEYLGRSCAPPDPDDEDPLDPPPSTEVRLDAPGGRTLLERRCDATGVFGATFDGSSPIWLRRRLDDSSALRGGDSRGETDFGIAVAVDGDALVRVRATGGRGYEVIWSSTASPPG